MMLVFLFLFGLALGAASPSGDPALGAASPSGNLALGAESASGDPALGAESASGNLALGAESASGDQEIKLPAFSWYSFNGRFYNYVATRMTWADAEFHCVSQRGNLVSIHSQEEQKFVESLIKNFDPAMGFTWIGLSDIHKEGRWMWSDGSAVDFVFWGQGQPDNFKGNEDCVHTLERERDQKWNDEKCSNTFAFVCASHVTCP